MRLQSLMNYVEKIIMNLFKGALKRHLSYQGGQRFFYSHSNQLMIKSGILASKVKFLLPSILVLGTACSLGWGSFFLFNSPETIKVVSNEIDESIDKPGIGGFGEIKEVMMATPSEIENEKVKDALLGISESEPELPQETAQKSKQVKSKGPALRKVKYRVRRGESIDAIAKRFHVSVGAIAGSSNLRRVDDLHEGQQLFIPSQEGFFYNIRKGDRLATILGKYRVALSKFLSANADVDADLLDVGDDIFLPGAKPRNLIRGWFIPVVSRIITSGYGWRSFPRRSFHKGLDLKAIYAPIRAARGGVVTFSGWLGSYGRAVVIKHSGGYKTLYAHLSRAYIRKGQRVQQGRVLGRSGNTGYSFGPHLHFEVTKDGKNISPHRILKGLRRRRRRR